MWVQGHKFKNSWIQLELKKTKKEKLKSSCGSNFFVEIMASEVSLLKGLATFTHVFSVPKLFITSVQQVFGKFNHEYKLYGSFLTTQLWEKRMCLLNQHVQA